VVRLVGEAATAWSSLKQQAEQHRDYAQQHSRAADAVEGK
jgi:hypothetical protein